MRVLVLGGALGIALIGLLATRMPDAEFLGEHACPDVIHEYAFAAIIPALPSVQDQIAVGQDPQRRTKPPPTYDGKPIPSTPVRNRENRSPKVAVWTRYGGLQTEGGLHGRHIS